MSAELILHMSLSLDGFLAHPDGSLDWHAPETGPNLGAVRHRANLELLSQVGTIVMGSGAYTEFKAGWSESTNPMAQLMNGLPKVAFSQRLTDVTWNNARLCRAPIETEIPALKAEADRALVCFGGARIAHSLMRQRLIDEFRLTIHPVALGAGLPLMHGLPEPQRLELISSTAYADGCVTQVFRP
jgi:dihydrofolate reductase